MLIVGLLIFLGLHSSRIFAENFRAGIIARRGEKTWKAIYSVLAIGGFVLIVYGYGDSRLTPITLWSPPRLDPPPGRATDALCIHFVSSGVYPEKPHQGETGPPDVAWHQGLGGGASAGEWQCRRRVVVRQFSGLGDFVFSCRKKA